MQENLSLYHIFYIVGKTGNISKAAKELYISQPAVSRAVQKLESNLDTLLFRRNSRGVIMTPDGQILFEKLKEAFSLVEEGEDILLHNPSQSIPHLRLGTSSTLCRYVLLSYLKPYVSCHPQVRINISCQSTYQTLQLLDEGKLDLGLIGRPRKLHGYHFRSLMHINDTFVATAQYLKNQQELYPRDSLYQGATFMMLDEKNITRQTIDTQLREHRIELHHILEATSMDLLIQFAKIGLGIAGVVRQFVEAELRNGDLVEVPVGFAFPAREIGFVCRKNDEHLPLLEYFFSSLAPANFSPSQFKETHTFPVT